MKLVLASGNAGKLVELRELLGEVEAELLARLSGGEAS